MASDYVPSRRSGGYAILLALYKSLRQTAANKGLTRQQLIERAQPLCDSSFEVKLSTGRMYSAWNAVKTLVDKGLVHRQSVLSQKQDQFQSRSNLYYLYTLTDKGASLASRLVALESASASVTFKESSPTASQQQIQRLVLENFPPNVVSKAQILIFSNLLFGIEEGTEEAWRLIKGACKPEPTSSGLSNEVTLRVARDGLLLGKCHCTCESGPQTLYRCAHVAALALKTVKEPQNDVSTPHTPGISTAVPCQAGTTRLLAAHAADKKPKKFHWAESVQNKTCSENVMRNGPLRTSGHVFCDRCRQSHPDDEQCAMAVANDAKRLRAKTSDADDTRQAHRAPCPTSTAQKREPQRDCIMLLDSESDSQSECDAVGAAETVVVDLDSDAEYEAATSKSLRRAAHPPAPSATHRSADPQFPCASGLSSAAPTSPVRQGVAKVSEGRCWGGGSCGLDVVVLVDDRERVSNSRPLEIMAKLRRKLAALHSMSANTVFSSVSFHVERRELALGDYMWAVRKGDGLFVLDAIVERKTMLDLIQGSATKHHLEQLHRLQSCGLSNCFLLVEGDVSVASRAPVAAWSSTSAGCIRGEDDVYSLFADCAACSGVFVACTKDVESSCRFLYQLTTILAHDLLQRPSLLTAAYHRDLAAFQLRNVKRNLGDERDIFRRQLVQIPGVTGKMADAVAQRYCTIGALLSSLHPCRTDHERHAILLEALRAGATKDTAMVDLDVMASRLFDAFWASGRSAPIAFEDVHRVGKQQDSPELDHAPSWDLRFEDSDSDAQDEAEAELQDDMGWEGVVDGGSAAQSSSISCAHVEHQQHPNPPPAGVPVDHTVQVNIYEAMRRLPGSKHFLYDRSWWPDTREPQHRSRSRGEAAKAMCGSMMLRHKATGRSVLVVRAVGPILLSRLSELHSAHIAANTTSKDSWWAHVAAASLAAAAVSKEMLEVERIEFAHCDAKVALAEDLRQACFRTHRAYLRARVSQTSSSSTDSTLVAMMARIDPHILLRLPELCELWLAHLMYGARWAVCHSRDTHESASVLSGIIQTLSNRATEHSYVESFRLREEPGVEATDDDWADAGLYWKRLWCNMLRFVPLVSKAVARAVSEAFPSPLHLFFELQSRDGQKRVSKLVVRHAGRPASVLGSRRVTLFSCMMASIETAG